MARSANFLEESALNCAFTTLVFAILSPANSIRQRVRYSMGDDPTVSLNLSAEIDRDMPARCPTLRPSNYVPARRG